MYTSKADPGSARRDRAPGFEIPVSATVDLGPIYNYQHNMYLRPI